MYRCKYDQSHIFISKHTSTTWPKWNIGSLLKARWWTFDVKMARGREKEFFSSLDMRLWGWQHCRGDPASTLSSGEELRTLVDGFCRGCSKARLPDNDAVLSNPSYDAGIKTSRTSLFFLIRLQFEKLQSCEFRNYTNLCKVWGASFPTGLQEASDFQSLKPCYDVPVHMSVTRSSNRLSLS